MSNLLFTFYGDDFTGSTDALEVLTTMGLRSILFTEPPTAELLSKYPGVQAVGIAGIARSLAPNEMESELRPAFAALHALRPRHLHYKVCSTFDSSSKIGSIGRAIEIGREQSCASFVPLLVANPRLGRYSIFGNLYAQVGVGHNGIVYRLDRHPTASCHPITPMRESDLRLHLAKQTHLQIGLFDLLKFSLPMDEQLAYFRQLVDEGADCVFCDALYPEQMSALGALFDKFASGAEPLFSAGSSGVEAALGAHWQSTGQLAAVENWSEPSSPGPILVASGSCSSITATQIGWAVSQGFEEISLESCVLTDVDCNSYLLQVTERVVNLIAKGKSVVVHTNSGGSGLQMLGAKQRLARRNVNSLENQAWSARRLGGAMGRIVSSVVEQTSVRRVCLAGGDTSSYAARALGVEAIEMICPMIAGAPLCRVYAPGRPADGLEICFKGGQVGKDNYFGSLL